VLPVGSLHSFVPHSFHSPTSCTTQQEHSFIPFRCTTIHSFTHLLFPTHTPTQVKRCSSIVPFCSAKTYLQGCNKLPSVALAYTVHFPVGLRSSRCSPPAVHLFCFTHFSQSSLAASSFPQTPL